MKKTLFFTLGSSLFLSQQLYATVETKPNILFILADDLGWNDLSMNGSDYYETPNIDKLAEQGMFFDNAYANAANSAPSRSCIMTGMYVPRHGVFTVSPSARGKSENRKLIPIENTQDVASEFVTLGEALQMQGYTCAHFGKWHMGLDGEGTGPLDQGFDLNIGGNRSGHPSSYFYPYDKPNLTTGTDGEYLTDRLTTEAIQFMDNRDQTKPFFIYMSHYTVHTPLQAKADIKAKYEAKTKGQYHTNATYAAMIESLDESVGNLLAALEERGLTENTIVVFFSDNGGNGTVTNNYQLRGAKGMPYEGGNREPLIIKYPGHITPNTRSSNVVIGTDFYPTFVNLAGGIPADNLDGKDIFENLSENQERDVFWHMPAYLEGYSSSEWRATPYSSIRSGHYKLIYFYEDQHKELYDLENDLKEEHNLAQTNPEKANELFGKLKAWLKETNAPIPLLLNPEYKGNTVTPDQGGGVAHEIFDQYVKVEDGDTIALYGCMGEIGQTASPKWVSLINNNSAVVDSSIYQVESAGVVDGEPAYYLKNLAKDAYISFYDDIEIVRSNMIVTYTTDKTKAIAFWVGNKTSDPAMKDDKFYVPSTTDFDITLSNDHSLVFTYARDMSDFYTGFSTPSVKYWKLSTYDGSQPANLTAQPETALFNVFGTTTEVNERLSLESYLSSIPEDLSTQYPIGTNPGNVPQNAYDAFMLVYNQAKNLLADETATNEALKNAKEDLKAAKENFDASIVEITDGFYTLITPVRPEDACMTEENNVLMWRTLSAGEPVKDPNYIWYITTLENDEYYLQNYGTKNYAQGVGAISTPIPAAAEPVAHTFTPIGEGLFQIQTKKHASYAYQGNTKNQVIIWTPTKNKAKWRLEAVPDDITSLTKLVLSSSSDEVDVYTIDGKLLRKNVASENALKGLPRGIYLVGRKKYVIQ